jgi:hypothetical protein
MKEDESKGNVIVLHKPKGDVILDRCDERFSTCLQIDKPAYRFSPP